MQYVKKQQTKTTTTSESGEKLSRNSLSIYACRSYDVHTITSTFISLLIFHIVRCEELNVGGGSGT